MLPPKRHYWIVLALIVVGLVQLSCAAFGPTQTATPSPTNTPAGPQGIRNPAIPFEAVIQIWALYYDEFDELQVGWTGSGTIISPDGLILTNAHVVLPDRYFPVDELGIAMTLDQDEEPEPIYYAEVLQADASLDLAVIRVTHDFDGNPVNSASLNLPYVPLGDSEQLNLGDELTILGYPGIGGDTVTLTSGEVSGFTSQPQYGARAFIKTSATIAGGNSGGLAADAVGRLVGVPTQLGYGGEDQYVDCRVLADTNRDGIVDENDSCVPTGGFINALRPVALALPLIQAAQRGEVNIVGAAGPEVATQPQSERVFDDFSDPNSGWDIYTDADGSANYVSGEYVIEDIAGDIYYYALANLNFDDVTMEVDVRILESTGANEIDLVCRYTDIDNYYEFRIYEGGNAGIAKRLNGEYIDLVAPAPSGYVLGEDPARVSIQCEGPRLSLSVNGVEVASASDESFSTGGLALSVYAWEGNRFAAAFDNFEASSLVGSTGTEVFFDDFSNLSSGWAIGSSEEGSVSYAGGSLDIEVIPEQWLYWSFAGKQFTDSVIKVDVQFTTSVGDADTGILCRYRDTNNFYAFEVSEDGYFSIWKMLDGEIIAIVDWQSSSLIPTNGSPFTLNAACDGAQLLLGINGSILAEATDADFASGDVGLIAGTYENGGVMVSFDNFQVIEP
ncbi:MAG: trypsin-like peptidase domain-containing protein [Anaerolineales bacterium]